VDVAKRLSGDRCACCKRIGNSFTMEKPGVWKILPEKKHCEKEPEVASIA